MLFSPITLGELTLPNRLIMAPLTRCRSGADGIPGPIVVEHYRQRASLGLIVSEGTYPSHAGQGFPGQPGLVTDEQVDGWSKVTQAVHAEGGRIFAQVMHAGRVTHEDTNGGRTVVGPSAVSVDDLTRTNKGKQPFPVPHALTEDEIPGVIQEFVQGSVNAIKAGFDGVELHGANGYLLHEFLTPAANRRDDRYGGSPENRIRFVVEVVQAVVEAVGAERVGIRISPEHNVQGAVELDREDLHRTYSLLVQAISPLGLAYLSVLHNEPSGGLVRELRGEFNGAFLLNTGFSVMTTRDEAISLVEGELADAVVVGRPAIANPDLVRRWQENLPVNEPDMATFYTSGTEGYTDYPVYQPA